MFQERTILISLDIYDTTIVSVVAKQYDTSSRFIEAICTENGTKINLDSETFKAIVVCNKPDDTVVVNNATILSNGNVLIELTQQMLAVAGQCSCDLMILAASGEINVENETDINMISSYALSTMTFQLNVVPFVTSNEMITSTNDFKTFVDAINVSIAVEKELKNAEALRVEAENTRANAESDRDTAESERVIAENARATAESSRNTSEQARTKAENARVNAESQRVEAENSRVAAENARVTAEALRVEAENSRTTAESARDTAESDRVNAENARVTAENARVTAETLRVEAENSRENSESVRNTAESDRANAENARVTAELARNTAESERVTAENARQTNTQNAINSCNTATENANNATERANAAAEACEGIEDGTNLVLKTDLYDENNQILSSKLNTDFTTQEQQIIVSGEDFAIMLGKIAAYMNAFDNKQQILYNADDPTAEPDNSIGNNGDIYVKVIQE